MTALIGNLPKIMKNFEVNIFSSTLCSDSFFSKRKKLKKLQEMIINLAYSITYQLKMTSDKCLNTKNDNFFLTVS